MKYEFKQERLLAEEVASCMTYLSERNGAEFVAVFPDNTEYADGKQRVYLLVKCPVTTQGELSDKFL